MTTLRKDLLKLEDARRIPPSLCPSPGPHREGEEEARRPILREVQDLGALAALSP